MNKVHDLTAALDDAFANAPYEEQCAALHRYVRYKEIEISEAAEDIKRMHAEFVQQGKPVDIARFDAALACLNGLLNQLRDRVAAFNIRGINTGTHAND